MEERIVKLKEMLTEVPALLMKSGWNNDFELWKSRVSMLLKREFGNEASKLFDQQSSPDFMNPFAYGREIVSRNEILEGIIAHAKEYLPEKVGASVTNKVIQSGKNGVVFEVGGNMVNRGVIHTGKDAVVGIAVAADYSSKNSKIIQRDILSKRWYEKPLGIIIITVFAGLIVAGIAFWLGWH